MVFVLSPQLNGKSWEGNRTGFLFVKLSMFGSQRTTMATTEKESHHRHLDQVESRHIQDSASVANSRDF